jgi:hypothetical protein
MGAEDDEDHGSTLVEVVELLVGFEKLVNRKRFLVPVLLVSEVQSIQ